MKSNYMNLVAAYMAWFLVGNPCHAQRDNESPEHQGKDIDWNPVRNAEHIRLKRCNFLKALFPSSHASSDQNMVATAPDSGFGSNFAWRTLEEAFSLARQQKKVLMLVIYKTGCPYCNAMKTIFTESTEIFTLSREFIMVNVEVHNLPNEERFYPDGSYIPRILFFGPNGQLMSHIYNRKQSGTQLYNYSDEQEVVNSMRKALKRGSIF